MRVVFGRIVAATFLATALPAQAGGISTDLLLSSAWCTFSYNKVTGYSKSSRVRFSPDGTYGTGSRGEGYSSGPYGSIASQRDAGEGGRWKVVKGELYLQQRLEQEGDGYHKCRLGPEGDRGEVERYAEVPQYSAVDQRKAVCPVGPDEPRAVNGDRVNAFIEKRKSNWKT